MQSAADIYQGRRWLNIKGLEEAGMVSYVEGLTSSMD
jgi:hypothetical protein